VVGVLFFSYFSRGVYGGPEDVRRAERKLIAFLA